MTAADILIQDTKSFLVFASWTALYIWCFWAVYVTVMGVYRAHLAGRLQGATKKMALPIVVVGYAMDLAANITVASVVFVDLPEEKLVTSRLIRYRREDADGWRGRLAGYICENLLDPFDPTGNHC